jgi:hypothetical protein
MPGSTRRAARTAAARLAASSGVSGLSVIARLAIVTGLT